MLHNGVDQVENQDVSWDSYELIIVINLILMVNQPVATLCKLTVCLHYGS